MLKGISKIMTGDLLKILCDMGHGDEIIIADANFPGESCSKRLVRLPGLDAGTVLREVAKLLPLDTYVPAPAAVLDMTDGDKASGMATPETWKEFDAILKEECPEYKELGKIERFAFYERSKKAYAVIQTGEERIYGCILLTKGVIK